LPGEFELIARYFERPTRHTALGVGDDGALIRPTPGHELVVSTDMLVEGTHFLPGTNARDLGWKTLAVNISDMAAMGAQPRWATLALALPSVDESWLTEFSQGFFECADAFTVDLIGGDTTRGPLCLSVTILAEVPIGKALRRDGAQVGDDVWVSGAPGRAALGLAHLQGRTTLGEPARSECIAALQRPQPRVALGLALRDIANAAIDVSDGLLADLGHILERSKLAATLRYAVPPAPTFTQASFLAGGDDYELIFTAPSARRSEIETLGNQLCLPVQLLGKIIDGRAGSLTVTDSDGKEIATERRGFDHFR
jgi:thiamine-monophosphate kinase